MFNRAAAAATATGQKLLLTLILLLAGVPTPTARAAEPAPATAAAPTLTWDQTSGEYCLRLQPGWNLVALPVIPDPPPAADSATPRLSAPERLQPWHYDRTAGIYRQTSMLQPFSGGWLYSASGRDFRIPASLPTGSPALTLADGWNLLGPAAPMLLTATAYLLTPFWTWDAARSRYRNPDGLLEPGQGYWLYCLQPVTLSLGDPRQDTDGDLLLDVWEASHQADYTQRDTDADGLDDFAEVMVYHTRADLADTDADGLPDAWEIANGLNPRDAQDAASDADGDGLSALAEFQTDRDPRRSDAALALTPLVRFAQSGCRIEEGAKSVQISLLVLGDIPAAGHVSATVTCVPALTSATAGTDFTAALPVQVDFDAAHRMRQVTVNLLADDVLEADERVTLAVTQVTGGALGAITTHCLVIADSAEIQGDSDRDGLPDAWELRYFGDLRFGPLDNPDGDDQDNRQEYLLGRNPAAGATPVPPETLRFSLDAVLR